LGGEDTRYFLALQEATQMESRQFVSSIEVILNDERVLTVADTTVEFPRRIQVAQTGRGRDEHPPGDGAGRPKRGSRSSPSATTG
jgi:hypothetical protein